ncbi:Protein phosphatase 1 regulatory subunit 7 [Dirofilaria immitis]|nr:Protein phosphatase 1 regulatory subunit 7 [Dirofilaria immitis]
MCADTLHTIVPEEIGDGKQCEDEDVEFLEVEPNTKELDLTRYRIKKIEALFLGANQIVDIENLDTLTHIEVLSLPANAIQEIKGLDNLATLRELYLSQNGIQYITGLENNINLEILDLNHNRLRSISNIRHLHKLTDFWAKKISTYRSKVIRMLPQIEKLDATYCRVS